MSRRKSKKSSPLGCLVLVIILFAALMAGSGSREDKQTTSFTPSSTVKATASTSAVSPTLTATPEASPTASPTPTAEPTSTPKKQCTYVYNKNTKKFHKESCSSADDIKPKNRGEYIGTREEMIKKGYDPCKRCKP